MPINNYFMKLQTQLPFKKETRNLIDYQSKIVMLGSCFSENMGNKLSYFKFQIGHQRFLGYYGQD